MKKFINDPEMVVVEELEGVALAHPDLVKVHFDPNYVVRADAPVQGKVGIISGGPGSFGIEAAVEKGLDCLITGEVYHGIWHLIQETGINVIAAGHYCTEKPGVIAVMQKIQQKFKLDCEFIELPTGL